MKIKYNSDRNMTPRLEIYRPSSPEITRLAQSPWRNGVDRKLEHRIEATGRVRNLVEGWSKSHSDKRLTLRDIKRRVGIQVSLRAIMVILDRMGEENSSFTDPRRFRERLERNRRKRIKKFLARWIPSYPGEKLSRAEIARELGIPSGAVERAVPNLNSKERKKLRETRKVENVSVRSVTRGIASYYPDRFVSLGTTLKEAGLPWKPTEAFKMLKRRGFEVQKIQVRYSSRKYPRYVIARSSQGRIVRFLKGGL